MARDKKLSPYAAASGGVLVRPGARRDGWAGGRVGPVAEPELGEAPDDATVLAGAEQAAALLTTKRAPAADAPASPEERKSIRRQVLGLAWPVIVENFLQTMIGVVDTALVGHLTTDALAGVGGAQQLVWLVTTLLSSVMMGATVLVGRAIGARQRLEARAAFKQAVIVSLAVSVFVGAIIFIGGAPFMSWMGLDPAAVQAGIVYVQITALATPLLAGMFVGAAALRGIGNTRTPMMITGFINLINAVAAWVLIYGFGPIPAMGVAGSAWAANLARLVGCGLLAWVFLQPRSTLTLLGKRGWRPDWDMIKRMLRIGLPTAAEQFFFSLGVTLYGIIVIGLGTEAYATQRVSMTVVQLSLMPGFGFGMAATTLVAQALGAGNVRRAEASTYFAMRSSVVQMSIAGLAFAVFSEPLMALFTSDAYVIKLGSEVLRIIAFNQPFMAVLNVLSGGLRGAGDTRFPMVTSTIGIWGVRLPVGWLLGIPLGLGLHGIYMVYVADAMVRAALVTWRWRQGKWKTMKV